MRAAAQLGMTTHNVSCKASLAPWSCVVCVDGDADRQLHLARPSASVALGVEHRASKLDRAGSWCHFVIATVGGRKLCECTLSHTLTCTQAGRSTGRPTNTHARLHAHHTHTCARHRCRRRSHAWQCVCVPCTEGDGHTTTQNAQIERSFTEVTLRGCVSTLANRSLDDVN